MTTRRATAKAGKQVSPLRRKSAAPVEMTDLGVGAAPVEMTTRRATTWELAASIADDLFKNGNNEVARRLVLELFDKRDGGGWNRAAVVNLISRRLEHWAVSR